MPVAAAAVFLARHRLFPFVLLMRSFILVGVLVTAWVLPALARRCGQDPAEAVALGVCNPVVVIQVVGGVHNEGLMLALLVAGLAMGLGGHRLLGAALCGLSAGMKVPGAGGAVLLGWDGGPQDAHRGFARTSFRPLAHRLARTAGAVGVALGTLAAATAAAGMSWGWIAGLSIPQRAQSLLAPTTAAGFALGRLSGSSPDAAINIARAAGVLGVVLAALVLMWRSDSLGGVWALGCVLVLFAVLGPTFYPWYLTWGLVLLAAAGPGRLRNALVAGSVLVNFTISPVGTALVDRWGSGLVKVWLAIGVVAAYAAIAYAVRESWRASSSPGAGESRHGPGSEKATGETAQLLFPRGSAGLARRAGPPPRPVAGGRPSPEG
jgi:alpha-1,6-mannosyltransferase